MTAGGINKEEAPRRLRCSLHDVELPASGECDECSKLLPVGRPVTLKVFDDGDDDGYRAWSAKHRGGYVINIQKNYNPSEAYLHQANCRTITGEPARGDVFVGDYVKVCALRRAELDDWVIRNAGASITPCNHCF
jgi:hypothetical protein